MPDSETPIDPPEPDRSHKRSSRTRPIDEPEPEGGKRRPPRRKRAPIAYPVADAAEASGLGRTTLYIAMANEELDFVKYNSRRVILHDDLVRFLKKHKNKRMGFKTKGVPLEAD
jgi:hypothetical protein